MGGEGVILLVGARGMLAGAIRAALRQRGATCVGVDRDRCDITDAEATRRVVREVAPKVVINAAAYTNVDRCEVEPAAADAVNGEGVGHLARACREVGATLVHFSTDYVFDGSLRRPLREDDPVAPSSAYGRSKLLGERRLREHAPPRWLIIRTAWLYGPGGACFPQTMLKAARAGRPLRVIDDQVGSPTYTVDLADATLRLLDARASGVVHVANAGQTTWFGFTRAIMDAFGVAPASLEPIGSDEWRRMKPDSAARPAYSVLDLAGYTRATGSTMPDWRDALARYRALDDDPR